MDSDSDSDDEDFFTLRKPAGSKDTGSGSTNVNEGQENIDAEDINTELHPDGLMDWEDEEVRS